MTTPPLAARRLRSPIIWFGGKGNMSAKILKYFPAHHTYCEPFGGGASMLFAKAPAPVEVYNDLDSGLVEFFRVLQDPDMFAAFERRVQAVPYSRQEYLEARDTWRDETDPVIRAVKWFIVARQSFGGRFGAGWGYNRTESNRGMAGECSKWLSTIDRLPEVHARLIRVQIEHAPAVRVIQNYDSPATLFYCDPPYTLASRKDGGYACEMTDADHAELLKTLLAAEGMVVLSGYPSPAYSDALSDWQRIEFKTACHAAGRTRGSGLIGAGTALAKQARTECLWLNPACTAALNPQGDLFPG